MNGPSGPSRAALDGIRVIDGTRLSAPRRIVLVHGTTSAATAPERSWDTTASHRGWALTR